MPPGNPSYVTEALQYVWDGSGWVKAVPAAGGGSGGDASAANQVLGNASLTAIDGKLGSPLAVTVGNFPATQPVSGSVSVGNWPATQPVSGTVSVGNWPATQPISAASPIPTTKQPTGGTNVLKTGTVTTTATTADQVVLTYTVTAGKTLYLTYLLMYGRLTTLAATASILGAISLESPAGTKLLTLDDVNNTTSEIGIHPLSFAEPIPIAAGAVLRVVVTPAAVTSMLWRANFGGYEK